MAGDQILIDFQFRLFDGNNSIRSRCDFREVIDFCCDHSVFGHRQEREKKNSYRV